MGRGSLKGFFPNLRFSSPLFTERGFFLPVAEGCELGVDAAALVEKKGNGLLSEVFGLFDCRHLQRS
jgi:hypothetical protein